MAIDELVKFRAKYPDYNDMPDNALADKLAAKFPEYADLPSKVAAGERGMFGKIADAVTPIASKIGENFSRSFNAPPPPMKMPIVPSAAAPAVSNDAQQQATEAAAARAAAAKTLGQGMGAARNRPKMTERQAAEAIVKNITPFPGVVDAITNPESPARKDLGTLLNPFPNVVNSAFETGLETIRGSLGHNAAKLVEDTMMNFPALHTIPKPIMFTDLYKAARTPTPAVKPIPEPIPAARPAPEPMRPEIRRMFADETGSVLTTKAPQPDAAPKPELRPAEAAPVPRETAPVSLTSAEVIDKIAEQQNPKYFDANKVIDEVTKSGDTFVKTEVDPATLKVPGEKSVEVGVSAPEKGPIVVGADGAVIDGRHRVVDAKAAGEPIIEAYVPEVKPVEVKPADAKPAKPLTDLSIDELLAMAGEKAPETIPEAPKPVEVIPAKAPPPEPVQQIPAQRRTLLNKEPPGGWTEADRVPRKPTVSPEVTASKGAEAGKSAPAVETQPEPAKSMWAEVGHDAELRRTHGLDKAKFEAYDPNRSVEKLGRGWSYKTVEGNSYGGYDTRKKAVEAAQAHKQMKLDQYENPSGYFNVVRDRARQSLELIKKYKSQGMSEMEAGARARTKIPDDVPPKIGDPQRVMGVDSVLADIKVTDDGMRYELYNGQVGKEKRAAVRIIDADSGNVVSIKQYPTFDAAEVDFKAGLEKANPKPAEPATVQVAPEPAPQPAPVNDIQARIAALEAENAKLAGKAKPKAKPEAQRAPDPKPAVLRRLADGMEAQIQAKQNPASANQNPTARRARIIGGMAKEAESMQRTQARMRAIADAAEAGTLPESLKNVSNRSDVEAIGATSYYRAGAHVSHVRAILEVTKGKRGLAEDRARIERATGARTKPGSEVMILHASDMDALSRLANAAAEARPYDAKQIREDITKARRQAKLGIETEAAFNKAKADLEGLTGAQPKFDPKAQALRAAETKLIGMREPGVFFTPKALAERVITEADIKPGMKVLEPSAGKGDIVDAIKAAVPDADVSAVELRPSLREILELKEHKVVGEDFLNYKDGGYDRIVMNPPFEGGLDGLHVQHAYELLAPGGKLVSIMGEGTFFRNDAKAKAFREWADSVGGTSEKLPEKSFTGAGTITQTGTATRLFTVEKPMEKPVEARMGGAVPEVDLSATPVTELIKKGFGSEVGAVGKLTPEQAAAEASARAARQEIYRRLANEAAKTGETIEGVAERLRVPVGLIAKLRADQEGMAAPTAPPPSAPPMPIDQQPNPGFITSIKNAMVDKELAEMGKPPATHGERMTFEAARDMAAVRVAVDPLAGKKLVDDFIRNPRPPTPIEDALLLHEQTRLKNERIIAEDRLIAAQKSGDPIEISDAKARVDAASADFMTVGDVVTRAGTESSLSLGHRRMMMKDDYSLAAMERSKQIANEGRPLSDAQRAEVKALHEKITATQKSFDEYMAKAELEKADLQSKIEHSKMVDQTDVVVDPHIRSLAQRILASMDSQAEAARGRLRAKLGRLSAGIDPTLISDAAIIGAAKLAHGVVDFAKWSKLMLEDLGEKIAPHLDDVWRVSNAQITERIDRIAGKSADKVTRLVAKLDVKDRVTVLKAQISDKMKVGGDIAPQAQELARTFVAQGVTKREALIDAVHAELIDLMPDITRRQTMDAISGYGQYHRLSSDQVSSQLRDLKGQMQQVAKLEDIMTQNPPLKTGVERRIPSDEERHLIQQVNEAKRRYGIVTTNSETQLKSTLDARKTYYQNQISDLEAQINANEKFVKQKSPSPTDAELEGLKARRTELKKQFDEVFGKEGLSDAQRIEIATKAAERSIEDLQKRIESRDLAPRKRNTVTPETPELQALRARQQALRDELQELRDAANPKATPEEIALKALKTRLSRQSAELLEKVAAGDFSKKPKREIVPDAEAKKLQFENAQAKRKWNEALMNDRLANRTTGEKIIGRLGEAVNTSRAVITSFDLSAVARQGGFVSLGHPIMAAKAFPDMIRAFRSEKGRFDAQQAMLARDNYPLYKRSGLYLSEDTGTLAAMEEAYMSRWAQKIPGVAGSERAYTTFLNKLRADAFDTLSATLTRNGTPSIEESKAIANYINVATGRGDLGMQSNALVGLNTIFFAPRYAASRFQLLAGQPMYRGTARTRGLVAKEYAKALIGLGTVYGLGTLAGAEVESDPRSSDFGKLRFGNTRVDPLMGLSQVTTLISREASGQTKSVKGRITDIRGDRVPYGGATSVDVLGRFLRSKLSPVVGAGVDVMAGKNVVGEPVTPESVAAGVTVPLVVRDIYDAMKDQGVPSGAALGLISLFGMGLQTFDPYKPRVKDERSFTERMSERLGFEIDSSAVNQ